jgi:hypothetical protein
MRDHARKGPLFKSQKKGTEMDMKPLALMLVLTALAASQPAHLFGAMMGIVMNVLRVLVH